MSDHLDPLGPKNLDKLFSSTMNYMRQAPRKHIRVGKETHDSHKPNAFCPICTAMHNVPDMVIETLPGDKALRSKPCPKCDGELAQGAIAIRCKTDARFCFVWSERLAGGENIIQVDAETYNKLMQRAEENKKDNGETKES